MAWIPSHVGIKGNEQVDSYAKEASDLPITLGSKIPYGDYKTIIKKTIFSAWEDQWSSQVENKLFKIKPRLQPYVSTGLPRRAEVVFNRLKIGHTYFTHRHLLNGDDKPFCIFCHKDFTVKHLLVECTDFEDVRKNFFTTRS